MTKTTLAFTLLVFCLASQIRADGQIAPPMITVSGSGEVDVQPTQALISIAIQQRNPSVKALNTQIDSIASNIIAYLKGQGISSKDIQTSYISVYPYYSQASNDAGDTTPDFYSGQKAMTFLLRKLSNYDTVMSGLYDLGLNRVDGVTFQVSSNSEESNKIEAKRRAVANAQEIASTIASQLGVTLGDVYSVTDTSYSGPIFASGAMMGSSADMSSSGPSISGGQITFSANVNVVFYISQAVV